MSSHGLSQPHVLRCPTVSRLAQIPKSDWDSLVGPGDSPFLEYDWLWCMEESGCASPETGRAAGSHIKWQAGDDA